MGYSQDKLKNSTKNRAPVLKKRVNSSNKRRKNESPSFNISQTNHTDNNVKGDYLAQRAINRTLLEEEIRQSHILYQTIVETLNSGLVILDKNGTLTYVNKKICDMLGYNVGELIGCTPGNFIDPSSMPVFEKQMIIPNKAPAVYDIICRDKNGTPIPAAMLGLAIFNEHGHFIGSYAIITDSTEKKLVEKITSIDSMTSVVAQELNQPLTVINLLLNKSLDKLKNLTSCPQNILKLLKDCLSESESAFAIIRRLRRFTRVSLEKKNSEDPTVNNLITKTEKIILNLILQGKSNKEIARILHRSRRTIEDHRAHIMKKLNVSNAVELTEKAVELGLLHIANTQ